MEITQSTMLADIDITEQNGKVRKFSISYIKKNGEYRHYQELSKDFKPVTPSKSNSTGKKNNYRVKEKGILRVYDHEQALQISLLIDGIIEYNNQRVV